MQIDPEAVVSLLSHNRKSLGLAEILNLLGASPGQRTELKRVMRELVRVDRVLKDGKRFRVEGEAPAFPAGAAPDPEGGDALRTREPPLVGSRAGRKGARFLIGILRKHADGYGFVEPLTGGGKGLFLPEEDARRALDGDLVKVEAVPGFQGKPAARFIDVVERRRTHLVGTLIRHGRGFFVQPLDPALGEAIQVQPTRRAQEGDLVKARILQGPSRREAASAEVAASLGKPGEPLGEVLEAAYRHGFCDEFPPDVLAAATSVPETLSATEIGRRRDLRELRLVTIDGEDARDFDDAVYVERCRRGWRLVVAIADVAHYVRPGSALDFEALRRGTSVYFPNFALPMLPERLSNGLCSLKPNEDRLCLVADMILERAGEGVRCVETEIYEGVMRSAARCTYNEVAQVLGGTQVPSREFLRADFLVMEELARLLIAARSERGSIDFDLPEVKAVLDEQHRPLRLEKRERNIAHRVIEEFMLCANEAVARHFSARSLPTVYRTHGLPDEDKLDNFLTLARTYGFTLDAEEVTGKALNDLLKKIAGSPEQRTLNFLLLRAMMQATYTPENIGHFGLAAEHYLHFTSPIRRYPDLMVHRLLKEHWARGSRSLPVGEAEALEDRLDGVAARSSERERAAMKSERDVHSFYAALFLKDHVGEEFDGTVCSVTPFGLFVELDEVFVEGLVKAEALGADAEFDEARHRLVLGSGASFGLGAKVRVRVASVNVGRRHIDFQLLALAGKPWRPQVPPARDARPPARDARPPRRDDRREERGDDRRPGRTPEPAPRKPQSKDQPKQQPKRGGGGPGRHKDRHPARKGKPQRRRIR